MFACRPAAICKVNSAPAIVVISESDGMAMTVLMICTSPRQPSSYYLVLPAKLKATLPATKASKTGGDFFLMRSRNSTCACACTY